MAQCSELDFILLIKELELEVQQRGAVFNQLEVNY